ncbi:hypothetical protein N7471_008509 [Penicillium samsonianum]|uniref:uncharacterized protein n=1 Tax=Penicillium samsonianum TaxID=1882272 RepID=UPI002546C8D3|nr:uncharacterized protein N7471_008509 [Penicillium samsonianum]KAJ6133294.1 hypothetical protein N7471_008509 [Penicillium samsonianum]
MGVLVEDYLWLDRTTVRYSRSIKKSSPFSKVESKPCNVRRIRSSSSSAASDGACSKTWKTYSDRPRKTSHEDYDQDFYILLDYWKPAIVADPTLLEPRSEALPCTLQPQRRFLLSMPVNHFQRSLASLVHQFEPLRIDFDG